LNIWIFQTGEPLPIDGMDSRPMRAMNLSSALISRGHQVTLWSSAFYHQKKTHRTLVFEQIAVSEQLTVNLIPSPGYTTNIGLGRLRDHAVLAYNLAKTLKNKKLEVPDVAFVGFPPIEAAAVLTTWLRKQNIPIMVDAKDQWPTIFLEPFPWVIRPLVRLALQPYFYLAKRVFRDASAFCSMSDEFIDWMCQVSGRTRGHRDHASPLTSPRRIHSSGALIEAGRWWRARGVDLTHNRRVAFVGTLSAAFDFAFIANLAKRCLANQLDVQFVICGSGDQSESVSRIMAGIPNVVLPGWIDTPKIETLMSGSRAVIAPYRTNDAFSRSIPNKVVDGFAMARPILTTLSGLTADTLKRFEAGLGAQSESVIFAELVRLMTDDDYFNLVSERSGKAYENHFSFEKVYGDLVESLCDLAGSRSSATP
jgi:glycosyltransferase involved in cell wall biosynthesis